MKKLTLVEATEYLDSIILEKKESKKNQFGITLNIADNKADIIGYITKYYNIQGIACKMKYCVLKDNFEIIIWW